MRVYLVSTLGILNNIYLLNRDGHDYSYVLKQYTNNEDFELALSTDQFRIYFDIFEQYLNEEEEINVGSGTLIIK